MLARRRVGAINWGFVAGKMQTIFPWDSWSAGYPAEPRPWFSNFLDFGPIENRLAGYEACLFCLFCLGVSSVGMSEADYKRVTYDVALAAAQAVLEKNPGLTFVFVSGANTDSTERGRVMWARVKGATENALLRMPFKTAYMFRPGYIQPMHANDSAALWIRAVYAVVGSLYPFVERIAPSYVTTTEQLRRAMLEVAKHGAPKQVLECADMRRLVSSPR
jgi:hypothetical protein